MKNVLNFSDKNVVVVGGTSGINLGVAEVFAKSGACVAVASRSQEKVDAAVEKLKAYGAEAMGFSADVRDVEAVKAGLKIVHDAFDDFDVLVSGAAGNFPATALGMSPRGFKAVVEIDLLGTFHVLQSAYPFLKKPGASVINISAPQAFIPMEAQSHACAAKAGVDMITRTLALEWGPDGIRINSVVPGPIDGTEGMKRFAPTEAIRQAIINTVPLRRLGTPEDIGNACLFLSSDLGNYISGAVILVDGGWAQKGAGGIISNLAQIAKAAEEK